MAHSSFWHNSLDPILSSRVQQTPLTKQGVYTREKKLGAMKFTGPDR